MADKVRSTQLAMPVVTRPTGWSLRLLALILTSLVGAVLALGPAATADAAPVHDEAAFVARINELRASRGLPALAVDARLTAIARNFAAVMAASGGLYHNPSLAQQAPGDWVKLGENVGVGGDVTSLHNAFVNSAPHLRNLLDAAYNSVGVGVVYVGGRTWVVEDFMHGSVVAPASERPAAATSPADRVERYKAVLRQG